MTDINKLCDELEAKLKKATPGPWAVDPDDRDGMNWNNHIIALRGHTVCFMTHDGTVENEKGEANAELIVLFRNAAQPLIDAARESMKKDEKFEHCTRQLREENVILRERIKELEKCWTPRNVRPPIYVKVLLLDEKGNYGIGMYMGHDEFTHPHYPVAGQVKISYWMELPSLPKELKERGG